MHNKKTHRFIAIVSKTKIWRGVNPHENSSEYTLALAWREEIFMRVLRAFAISPISQYVLSA
jgi:hypothetical protein